MVPPLFGTQEYLACDWIHEKKINCNSLKVGNTEKCHEFVDLTFITEPQEASRKH